MNEINNFEYAGFWKRFIAFVIDQIILSIASSILVIPLLLFFGLSFLSFGGLSEMNEYTNMSLSFQNSQVDVATLSSFILVIILFSIGIILIKWLYFSLMESSTRQATLGKMALGIKVVGMNGERISFGKATGRYFGKIISGLILYIGFMMAGWTVRKQALHDIMAGCLVINQ